MIHCAIYSSKNSCIRGKHHHSGCHQDIFTISAHSSIAFATHSYGAGSQFHIPLTKIDSGIPYDILAVHNALFVSASAELAIAVP